MSERGPVTRCRFRGCPFLGHFAAFDGWCPEHRPDDTLPAQRMPTSGTPDRQGQSW